MRVEFQGDRFTVRFDGKTVIEASDEAFSGPGGVGVWTKIDSVTTCRRLWVPTSGELGGRTEP